MSDFFAYFLTYLPTPVRFYTTINFQFSHMVSDFGNTTYLPKNQTSSMDIPKLCTKKTCKESGNVKGKVKLLNFTRHTVKFQYRHFISALAFIENLTNDLMPGG